MRTGFGNTYPYQITYEKTDWVRIEAYGRKTGLPNVMHIMNTERPEQYRGVTYLAPIIEPLLQIKRYTDAEIMAAVVQAFFSVFIKSEAATGADGIPFNEVGDGQEADDQVSYDPNEYEMGAGNINVMNPGESVELVETKRPNSGFEPFFKAMCKQIGAALEIPAELLIKEFTASYSASRAALLEAWKAFKMYRNWFASSFCKPVYEIWLSEAIARGRVNAPGFFSDPLVREAWLGSEWIGPSQGQLDPVKEVNAEILSIQNGLTTHEAAAAKINGSDWDTNIDQLEMEFRKIDELEDRLSRLAMMEEEDREDDSDSDEEL